VRQTAALLLCVLLLAPTKAQDRPLPDLATFVAAVRVHLNTDEERQSGYAYRERTTEEKVDEAGRPVHTSVKVFEVYPGLPGEDRYRRLIEQDGKPVSPDTLASGDRVRQKAVESYARSISTDAGRQEDARRRGKDRREVEAAIDDLFRIYEIQLVGRESIDGHDTIVAALTPRAGVKPQTDDGKMMRHFKARAWVSDPDYEVVRVEISALDDLSIGWGLFARVHKGASATYQRRKVNEEVWLPERVTWNGSGRLFLLKRLRMRGVSEFSGYRKFTVDTSTIYSNQTP
jgi:hypothetical protein